MELQIGEISGEISVNDLRLIIRDNIRLWNWGVSNVSLVRFGQNKLNKGKSNKTQLYISLSVDLYSTQNTTTGDWV